MLRYPIEFHALDSIYNIKPSIFFDTSEITSIFLPCNKKIMKETSSLEKNSPSIEMMKKPDVWRDKKMLVVGFYD